jgi:hypothetical protein
MKLIFISAHIANGNGQREGAMREVEVSDDMDGECITSALEAAVDEIENLTAIHRMKGVKHG